MNKPDVFVPGTLEEYCWMHTPGGWDCPTCFAQYYAQDHLTRFFAGLSQVIKAVLDAWELSPEQLTAVEIIPGIHAGEWAVHVEPEMPYFALVSYRDGE